jgi:hypothetical protein
LITIERDPLAEKFVTMRFYPRSFTVVSSIGRLRVTIRSNRVKLIT